LGQRLTQVLVWLLPNVGEGQISTQMFTVESEKPYWVPVQFNTHLLLKESAKLPFGQIYMHVLVKFYA